MVSTRGTIFSMALLIQPIASLAADCGAQPTQENSEVAIRQLEQQWSQAYWTGNAQFLECLYAADFQSVDSKGKLHARAEDIAGSLKYTGKSWAFDPHKYQVVIIMHPHAAIATNFRGDAEHGFRVTDIYEYDGAHWHAIFSQDTQF
jgi:hypothetical protein